MISKYNYGPAFLQFLYKDGSLFNGSMEDFEKEHGRLSGFKDIETNNVFLLNEYGGLAATTTRKESVNA